MYNLNCERYSSSDLKIMNDSTSEAFQEDLACIKRGLSAMQNGLDRLSKAVDDPRYADVYNAYVDDYIDLCDTFNGALYCAGKAGQDLYEATHRLRPQLRYL